jgi:hypothetical protein
VAPSVQRRRRLQGAVTPQQVVRLTAPGHTRGGSMVTALVCRELIIGSHAAWMVLVAHCWRGCPWGCSVCCPLTASGSQELATARWADIRLRQPGYAAPPVVETTARAQHYLSGSTRTSLSCSRHSHPTPLGVQDIVLVTMLDGGFCEKGFVPVANRSLCTFSGRAGEVLRCRPR